MSGDYMEMLAGAKLPKRTIPVCMRGDLVAEFEDLSRELDAALRNPETTSSKEGGEEQVLAARMEDLREQMAGATYQFVLQALPRPQYRDLKQKYPPRQNDDGEIKDEDRFLDVNIDDFAEPLLRASLVDPKLDAAGWASTIDVLSDGQYDQLIGAAIRVNKGGVDIPFSPVASSLLRSSSSA